FQQSYVDSILINMPKVDILSLELERMLDTLIYESSKYETLNRMPDYPSKISVSTNSVPNNIIILTLGKGYIMSYNFPNAEFDNPFYPNIYPLIPSKLGLSKYRNFQIV